MSVVIDIPGLRLISEANDRCHWRVRWHRTRTQRLRVAEYLTLYRGHLKSLRPPLAITLTRLGKRRMDCDNLAGSFKAAADELCQFLGIDDGDFERLSWEYRQEIGKDYGLRIELKEKA